MKTSAIITLVAALGISMGLIAQEENETQREAAQGVTPDDTQQLINDWPDVSKEAANTMTEKYGQPDEATPTMLVWHNNGPWLRTIVYKEEIDHDFPVPHKDVLEQFVSYEVPPDKFDDLAEYDGSVIAERTKGELSARCDKEAANYLAINLADDVVKGERSVEEAREFYAETIKELMQGEKPEYTTALLFDPPPVRQARDSDERAISVAELEQLRQGEMEGAEIATFSELDKDDSGDISRQEAEDNQRLSDAWEQFDLDDNDRLDPAEFSAFEAETKDQQ
ncbi:EF-hand domain-containing protein [Thiohalomonas denitrificans]|uniref:EF hand n=1 Tax=Thiohalomonas denitrificans TaxID=415747 RepID=A0A1G5QX78_9GAMM|nr:hypothetical protein [Thiohalomonas denitrificans]SCZ65851.1 hypothetical protein SAMN03097708_02889 [Thiohalomonas denitrificans]